MCLPAGSSRASPLRLCLRRRDLFAVAEVTWTSLIYSGSVNGEVSNKSPTGPPDSGADVNHVYHFDRVLMVFDYLRIDGWFVSEGDRVTEIMLYFGEQCMHRERANVRLPSPDLTTLPPPHDWRFSISCLAKDVADRRGG